MARYAETVQNDGGNKTQTYVPTGNINRNATNLTQAYATPTSSVSPVLFLNKPATTTSGTKATTQSATDKVLETLQNGKLTTKSVGSDFLSGVKDTLETIKTNNSGTTDTGNDKTYDYTPVTQYTDYYSQLMDLFTNTNEQARQNQIDAILKNLESVKGSYKNRIQQVMDEYDALINENEVNKYRARKSIRENQANRGQLNSGLGRQEQLQMNMNYDNNANKINTARQNAINEIYNLITQAEAEAEQNKATVNNTYANALLQYQLANQ